MSIHQPAPGTITVFLLDDHELLRRGVRDLLEAAPDIRVVGESGLAREGVRRILATRPDVALLDVQLPDDSGIVVCRTIRNRDPSIMTLMLTTFDDDQARTAALMAGAAGFVLKQIRGPELVDAVRLVAAGQRVPPDSPNHDVVRPGDPRLATLTPRERRVLELIAEGLTNRQIGARLDIGEKTVRNHVTSLLAKLGLQRRTQAAVYAVKNDAPASSGRNAAFE